MARNHQILTFWGFCTQPSLPNKAEFGMQEQAHNVLFHAKFHLDHYSVWQKSSPLTFIAVFSATALNFHAKFFIHMYSHLMRT